MEKRYYVDGDTFEQKYEWVFSEGDVVEIVNTRGLQNWDNTTNTFVVKRYCPQIGVPDKIETCCRKYLYAFRFKLLPYKVKVKL